MGEQSFTRHRLSYVYPEDPRLIERIAENMRTQGFDNMFPVVTFNGEILDGWHRFSAAKRANVEPVFSEFEGDAKEAEEFILRANSDRRHLSKKAQITAVLLSHEHLPDDEQLPDSAIVYMYGVSQSQVNVARKAIAEDRDGAEEVAQGRKSADQHERDTGARTDNPPRIKPLECTNSRLVERYYKAIGGDPAINRKAIRPKSALNDLLKTFCDARENGLKVVAAKQDCSCGALVA